MERDELKKALISLWLDHDDKYKSAVKKYEELNEEAKKRDLTLIEMFDREKLKDEISFQLGAKNAICEAIVKI